MLPGKANELPMLTTVATVACGLLTVVSGGFTRETSGTGACQWNE